MINRIFFISGAAFQPGNTFPGSGAIFFCILVNPEEKTALANTYSFMSASESSFALALDISAWPGEENIRTIASFLFLPSYLRVNKQPVINLVGQSEALLDQVKEELSGYFLSQGITNYCIHTIRKPGASVQPGQYNLFHTANELAAFHHQLLQQGDYEQPLFFYTQSHEELSSAITMLQKLEEEYKNSNPALYRAIEARKALEAEVIGLKEKLDSTQAELCYQQQHNEILRSEHSTKKLQDYYTREYEVLPKWYKRFGHIIKVMTGKRKFSSLFNDGVKNKKD